ncbi:MAG: hypothetical protein FJW37_06705, partial [Acidobacteria bacterium]|nr:hypothetical protein [Acidobacteriota bacterium]
MLSATGWRSHSWLRRSPARWILLAALAAAGAARGQIAVLGETVYTMEGPPIVNGVVLVRAGKIERVGPAGSTPVPKDYRELRAKVVTPGLI